MKLTMLLMLLIAVSAASSHFTGFEFHYFCPKHIIPCRCSVGYEEYYTTNPITHCRNECECRKKEGDSSSDEDSEDKYVCPEILPKCECNEGFDSYYKTNPRTGCKDMCVCHKERHYEYHSTNELEIA